jgi:hypothetical protein
MTTVTLTLNPELAQQLWVTATSCFFNAQPERFEHMELLQVPFEDKFKEGTMFWCATASDALLLMAYERACDFNSLLLWDLAEAEQTFESECRHCNAYVVMSARHWQSSMKEGSSESL